MFENLGDLVARILLRSQSLSENNPLDPTTFGYLMPLIDKIIFENGVGVSKEDHDSTEEQLTLSLQLLSSHCAVVSDTSYPRSAMMKVLLKAIGTYTKYSKDASNTLVNIGESLRDSATFDECNILIKGTLADEVYVRSSCLQSLQVSFIIYLKIHNFTNLFLSHSISLILNSHLNYGLLVMMKMSKMLDLLIIYGMIMD